MVSIELLEKAGITRDNLCRLLTGDPLAVDPAKGMINPSDPQELRDKKQRTASLLHRIRSRVQEGMARNLTTFRTYWALDLAWDTPFRNFSPTLLSTMMDKDVNDEKVRAEFRALGVYDCIKEIDEGGKKRYEMNFPLFVSVIVPLVQAYVKIRWAKIMNDRRLTPFFEYVPAKLTTESMAKCAAITDRVQVISQQYGYYDVQKQGVLKMLHYGMALQFVKESWHWEDQQRYATAEDVAEANGTLPTQGLPDEAQPSTQPEMVGNEDVAGKEPQAVSQPVSQTAPQMPNQNMADAQKPPGADDSTPTASPRKRLQEGDVITATEREGLRYHLPHITRFFYDMAHGPYTINYDYGCEFYGYWRIERYRTIQNSNFWNKDKIALGTDLISSNPLFFQTVYGGCTMTIPVAVVPEKMPDGPAAYAEFGGGSGKLDRERQLATLYYGNEHGDQGTLVTEYFEKLVPSQWGLGDYDYPVWFRFTVAGDGCTVLYAEPIPFPPAIYYGYDADESRSQNASMSLEILPFQDQFSNTLTQILLTARQNLANLVFVDESQVEAGIIDTLKNVGERMFRKLNIFKYDSRKSQKFMGRISEAVQSFKFPQGNTAELTNVLKTILDVLERILVMSSNEVGQAASHEQTREEIRNIQASTSSRLVFTKTPVDIAAEAWKRQLYLGLMNYGDEHMYVHIPSDMLLTREVLEAMGFTYMEQGNTQVLGGRRSHTRYRVPKKIVAINLWEFASMKDQEDRINNDKIALALARLFEEVLGNPITAQAIGPDQAIEFANQIAHFAGLPADFRMRNTQQGSNPQQQQAEAQGQLKQVVDTVLAQVNNGLKVELEPLLTEVGKNSRDIATIMRALTSVEGHPANDTNGKPQPAPTRG